MIDYRSPEWRLYQAHRWGLACGQQCDIHQARESVEGDVWNLQRFIEAQDNDGAYERALEELRRGRKETDWMWFVFPQIWGVATRASPTTIRYSLASPTEAKAYAEYPLLQARLWTAISAISQHREKGATSILGTVDAQKLQACLTLFDCVDGVTTEFYREHLYGFFDGPHLRTLEVLRTGFPTYPYVTLEYPYRS